MFVSTLPYVPGREIQSNSMVASYESVSNPIPFPPSNGGRRVTADEIRQTVLEQLIARAEEKGADALINVRITSADITPHLLGADATGEAVVLVPQHP